jgi:GNAT superfamily N-acetyltransferase
VPAKIGGIAVLHDMLVKLYSLEEKPGLCRKLKSMGISVKRAMPVDKGHIVLFVRNNFGDGPANECSYSFTGHPVNCFIAVREKRIIGFACYNTVAKDFFGPIGVYEKYRGMGVGEALLRAGLLALKNSGFAYAIVSSTEETEGFYRKTVGATIIEDSFPGVYQNMISVD